MHTLSLRAPSSLSADSTADQAVRWRSGDLVVALPPAAFAPDYQPPCFHTDEQVRHCAIWAADFSVTARVSFILWRPGQRAIRGHAPAGSQWRALDYTFAGDFSLHYPGRWVPVPWIAQEFAHLVVLPDDPSSVNVVVEADGHCWCATVTAATDAWQLWTDLPTVSSQPRVLGVPHQELRQGTTLRSGDIVSGTEPAFSLRVARGAFGLAMLHAFRGSVGILALALLLASPLAPPVATGMRLSGETEDWHKRTPDAPAQASTMHHQGTCHRLWDPAGSILGPFWGPAAVPPSALQDAAPACPPLPKCDRHKTTVLWTGSRSPRIPYLPLFSFNVRQPPGRRCYRPPARLLISIGRAAAAPDLPQVLAPPEMWCGLSRWSWFGVLGLWTLCCQPRSPVALYGSTPPEYRAANPPNLDRGLLARTRCYLRAWGAPSWSSSDGISWTADLHEECVAQASLHQLWWSHDLFPCLPASAPASYHREFSSYPLWPGGVPEQLFIATDGSVSTVGLGPSVPGHGGAAAGIASAGSELLAAGLWLVAWVDRLSLLTSSAPTRVTIAVDNAAALQIAAGQAQAGENVTTDTRYVWQAVQSRLTTRFQHVHSHVGIMPNTLADLGHRGWRPWKQTDPTLPALFRQAGPWLWAVPRARVQQGRPCLQLVSDSLPPAPQAEEPYAQESPSAGPSEAPVLDEPRQPTTTSPVPLRIVTANVQTMHDSRASFFNPSGHGQRRQDLYSQVDKLSLDIVCLQETRSKGGRWDTAGLLTWRSGAAKGSYGCEIWVRPHLTNPPLRLDDWRITSATPRSLIIVCKRADFPLAIAVAHAPHADRPAAEIHQFWSLLQASLCQLPRTLTLVIGLDANADLLWADEDHAFIGDGLGCGEEGAGEQGLFDTMQRFRLTAPASFSDIQVGPGWSWEHTGGTRKRLDHILLQAGSWQYRRSCQLPEFDILNGRRDHMPLLVECELRGRPVQALKRRHLRLLRALPSPPRSGRFGNNFPLCEPMSSGNSGVFFCRHTISPALTNKPTFAPSLLQQLGIGSLLESLLSPSGISVGPLVSPTKGEPSTRLGDMTLTRSLKINFAPKKLEQLCIRQAPAKAPGPDGLRNELWRSQGAHAGRWLWPLCARIALQGREPFDFKAAIVCALYKKGPASLPANYRSIALLNGVAKLWHSHLRSTIGGHILSRYEPMQLGGRKGVHTEFALAAFRCAWDLSVSAGRCLAVVFVDIQAAYYEASRDLLFDGFAADAQVPEHHHLAGLVLQLQQQGALAALGVADDVAALLRDCVALSHWSLSGSSNIFLASRGSRPGDGLADILFGALFAVGLQHIQRATAQLGITHTSAGVEVGLPPGVKPIGWADDLAVLADFDCPADLQAQLPQLVRVILETLRLLRFRVNLGAGKTEALVDIRGEGARAARGALLSGDALLQVSDSGSIRLCPEYKYLGVAQLPRDTGRRDCELAAQRGSAAASMARTLLCSNCLPWELKRAWVAGRVLPSAYSSLAMSLAESGRATAPLAGLFERTARILLSSWQVGHKLTTPLLRLFADVPPPDLATVISQCRLCVQLFCKAPAAVRDIVDAAWNRALPWCQALVSACMCVGASLDLWDPEQPPAITVLFVQSHGRALLRACKSLSKFGHRYAACAQLWDDLSARRTTHVLGAAQSYRCPVCRDIFPSLHAVRAHLHRKHGVLSDVTAYMAGSVCLWCMQDFHSSDRLKYHLQTQRPCLHGLRVTVGPVYQYGSGTKRKGRAAHRGVPPQRLCGPCNATPVQRRAARLGVPVTEAELQEEWDAVQRSPALSDLVPGNLHRVAAGSASASAPVAVLGSLSEDAASSPLLQNPVSSLVGSLGTTPLQWYSFVEGAAACVDWALPSPWWPGLLALGGVFRLPSSWHRLWSMWSALELFSPWEHRAVRRFGVLRSASSCGLGAPVSLADATAGRRSLLELAAALVSFRMVCKTVHQRGAMWISGHPGHLGLALLRRLLPAAVFLDFWSSAGRVFLAASSASLASSVRSALVGSSAPPSLSVRAFWAYPAA
ncbi:unnamed protein product [Symbiodinium sp. CCMP2592]|nr:unnamed protein product [Symbiodinium sp. CCMP2592]